MVIDIVDAAGLVSADELGALGEKLLLHLFTEVLESDHVLVVDLLQRLVASVVLFEVSV